MEDDKGQEHQLNKKTPVAKEREDEDLYSTKKTYVDEIISLKSRTL